MSVISNSDGGATKIYEWNNILYREFSSPNVSIKKKVSSVDRTEEISILCIETCVENTDTWTSRDKENHWQSYIRILLAERSSGCITILQFQWHLSTNKYKRQNTPCSTRSYASYSEPFHRVSAVIVGPLDPWTTKGNKYILTIINFATRHHEAAALSGIETEQLAKALVHVFSRVGVPRTDQGTQFTSDVMKKVSRLLSLKGSTTTPYHRMCNDLVGKFNGTLKHMLKRMCAERPKDCTNIWTLYCSHKEMYRKGAWICHLLNIYTDLQCVVPWES